MVSTNLRLDLIPIMHIHATLFLVFHILFSTSTALPASLPPPSPSLQPAVPAVKGSAHYKTRWILPRDDSIPLKYTTRTAPPEIWTGNGFSCPEFRNNELEQNAPLIQEAVDKCRKGNCKYYGEGRTGIAWLVTLSDGQQHILKVMFGPDTRNRFTVRGHSDNKTSGHDKPEHITQADDFAKIVYMTNRVTQLEAFGVLENHLNRKPVAFYILMPYLGLSFRLAFDKHRDKFTNQDGIFVWADRSKIVSAYRSSYAVKQRDFFWDNFVFNEEPWDVRLVDWSEGWDLLFEPPYRPTYQQIAKIVVQVQDPNLHGYYNDKTNNDHEQTAKQTAEFFEKLQSFVDGQQPIPLDFKSRTP